jgi:hypothetical protein
MSLVGTFARLDVGVCLIVATVGGDMRYPREDDLASLKAAHAQIERVVGSWLPPRPGV